ncbi:hypothetical protein LIER_27261 [Lithospermum erythrorhizon]|uniref:DUF4283 domain-containing protein n=1 Tax=Lithospermum erythrorhizon TaxID=34254 RepID=A0AAV3RBD5_LITER
MWVLFHDVPLSVWSESGLSKIASKVGIPMYTDKVTKERTKMSYPRCLVDVDVSKPPVLEFGVKLSDGRRYIQKVTYECYTDNCCDCKTFGHNIFKCPKKSKAVKAPVVPPPVVSPREPNVHPVPVAPPMVTRSRARVKSRGVAPPKEPLPKDCVNVPIESGSLPGVIESMDLVDSPSIKGKGLKGVGKVKTIAAQVPVISPNSFEVLNGLGRTSGTHDADVSNVQTGALVPSLCDYDNHGCMATCDS